METVPVSPTTARQAEKVQPRLLSRADQERSSKTKATVKRLMDRYLKLDDIDTTTRAMYEENDPAAAGVQRGREP
nr:hypothetical protein [uncultured Actinoplanes sp.]